MICHVMHDLIFQGVVRAKKALDTGYDKQDIFGTIGYATRGASLCEACQVHSEVRREMEQMEERGMSLPR